MKNTSKTTTNSSAAGNLYQVRMGPNSNTKTPETHNLDAQTPSNCFEKKRRCNTIINMPPCQLFWDLQQTSNWKWAHFVHTIVKLLSLNICYVIYDLLWIKYWLMWFESLLDLYLSKIKNKSGVVVFIVILDFLVCHFVSSIILKLFLF